MAEPSPQKVRLWRDELQDPLAPEVRKPRVFRMFIALALMAGLIGLFFGMIIWARPAPRPLFVPLWVTQHHSLPIPAVSHALQDQQALGNRHYFKNEKSDGYTSQQGHEILALLQELEEETEPVVVYLCTQSVRDSKGEILLLPADAQPDNPATFIPLAQVLELLKKCPSTSKLLILDIAHDLADPRLGSLSNNIAEAIPAAVEAVEDPNLLVLTSCSPGQVSLSSEAIGRSVFGYYLEQGLRGWADGFLSEGGTDGRISVKELAAFVAEKVDRWAQLNRDSRQIPVLLGQGKNFPLRAFTDDERAESPELPPAPEYPKWLLDSWKTVDASYTTGSFRLTPYLFRHQTALLLRAEQHWRDGVEVEQIQGTELAAFAQLQKLLPQKRSIPMPQPQSLALALKQQVTTPLALGKELDKLVQEWQKAGQAAKPEQIKEERDKLVGEFLKKHKDEPPLLLAHALFTQAAELESPARDEIILLHELLQLTAPDKKPQHLELLVLQELAKLAENKKSAWPAALVQKVLQATRMGEQAGSSLQAFPWIKETLETTAQARHEGEFRFWGQGYAAPAEADQILTSANSGFQGILNTIATIETIRETLDEAMFFLPAYLPYLDSHPDHEATWLEAVESTAKLYQGFLEQTSIPAQASARLKEMSPHLAALRKKLEQLQQPFSDENIKLLIAISADPRAKPVTRNEINSILKTPFLAPENRAKLWKAGLDLERRLHQKTGDLDEEDHIAGQTAGELLPYDQEKWLAQAQLKGLKRAQWMLSVFQLGGLNEDSLARLQKAYTRVAQGKGEETEYHQLAAMIQRAWVKEARDQYQDEGFTPARDRLIRIFPPLDGPPGLQADQPSDAALVLAENGKQLWTWLADHHQYQARDYQGSGLDTEAAHALGSFHAKAAGIYEQLASSVSDHYLQFKVAKAIPLLSPERTDADSVLEVALVGAKKQMLPKSLPLKMQPPSKGWLQVSPQSLLLTQFTPDPLDPLLFKATVPFQVKLLDTGIYSSDPEPLGFLASANLGKKSFHKAVKVPLRTGADELQIILSPNPKLPDPPLDSVRLRPGKVQQTFHLFVYNPGSEARKVIVQLLKDEEVLKGGEVALIVAAKESVRVPLGTPTAPAPKPATPPAKEGAPTGKDGAPPASEALPPFKGKLEVRLLDGDDKTLVLAKQPIKVDIAHPREYVTVRNIKFDPAAQRNLFKNQLSVTLEPLVNLPGPDISAELILPPDRIPALLTIKDGMFKGTLPPVVAPPAKLTLFAKELQLSAEVEPEGYFYIHVDGYQRCFIYRTFFANQGDPLTPKSFFQPEVRFSTKAYELSSSKFSITAEVNNAPENTSLKVTLGRIEAGKFIADVTETFATPKNQQIGFALDSSGAMVFEARIEDWQVALDTSKIRGTRKIMADLLDEFGKVIAHGEQTLTLDDTPPENVQFVKYPAKAQKGTKVLLRAIGNDPESGIKEAVFFAGTPENDKVPAKIELIQAVPAGKNGAAWEAQFPLPEKKGVTPITVAMTNKVGLTRFDTVNIELMDTDPATTGPGSIKGKVLFGELSQQNLPVYLYDEKGKPLDETKTKPDGTFLFANLKPGNYILYSLNKGAKRDGSAKVPVKANQTAEVTIKLQLK